MGQAVSPPRHDELSSGLPNIGTALIVSGDNAITTLLKPALERVAIASQVCDEVQTCVRLVSCRRFEAAFIDFNLEEDAMRAITAIRSGPSTRTSVIIAITSDSGQSNRAFSYGVHFVLQQPISQSSVDGILRAAFGLIVRERRRYFRCPIDVGIVAQRRTEGAWSARTANISEDGICIVAPVPLKPGESLELDFTLPTGAEISVESDVQWSDDKGRTGLKFIRMRQDSRSDLQHWLTNELDKQLRPALVASERVPSTVTADTLEDVATPYQKKLYQTPELNRYKTLDDLPVKLRTAAEDILKEHPALKVTIDKDHRSVSVSEEFAHLLGYNSRQLLGKSIDEITSEGTVDVDFIFRILQRLRVAKGLWLFETRRGKKMLCSYRATRSNTTFVAEFTPLFVAV